MPKPLIHFKKEQLAFHQRMMTLCAQTYGMVVVPAFGILNNAKGPGHTIGTVMVSLENSLSWVLKYSPLFLENASRNVSSPHYLQIFSNIEKKSLSKDDIIAKFYDGLTTYYINAFTSCSYIITALCEFQSDLIAENPQVYHDVISYYLLLSSILSYNAIVLDREFNDGLNVKALLESVDKWMFLLESEHLQHVQDPQFHVLHRLFLSKFYQFKSQLTLEATSLLLPHDELDMHVKRKNEHAQALGSPYSGMVIFKHDSSKIATVDSDNVERLIAALQNLQSTKTRQQILFYPNQLTGPVELFDAVWDEKRLVFNIIHVHSACSSQQYELLRQLQKRLESLQIPYQILACQADIQHQGQDSSAIVSYSLSGILSHLSFNKLVHSPFVCAQPVFYDYIHATGKQCSNLDNVTWFKIQALGKKAVLMANPRTQEQYQTMLGRLATIVPQQDIPKVITSFCKKYRVQIDPSKPNLRHYVQDLRQRLRKRAQGEPFFGLTLENVMAQLETDKPGQAMRRAAAGLTDVDSFDFLLEKFSALSLDANPINEADLIADKGFRPLHLSLKEDLATRAVKLLKSHAEPYLEDAHHQTAVDVFEAKESDSKVKTNPELRKFLYR